MQFGFRAERSTLHAVQKVQKGVTYAFGLKPKSGGFALVVVSLHVKNVFNSVSWENIYLALNRRLLEYLLRVSSNYVEDRKLLVETKDGTIELEISAGGSMLDRQRPSKCSPHTRNQFRNQLICYYNNY